MPNSGNSREKTNKTWGSISCGRKRRRGDAEAWCTQGVHAFNVKLKIMRHYYKSLFHQPKAKKFRARKMKSFKGNVQCRGATRMLCGNKKLAVLGNSCSHILVCCRKLQFAPVVTPSACCKWCRKDEYNYLNFEHDDKKMTQSCISDPSELRSPN